MISAFRRFLSRIKNRDWRNKSTGISIKHEATKLGRSFEDNVITLLISAFGLTAGLTWNSAIQETIRLLFPADVQSLYYKIYAALIVTVIAVFVTFVLSRFKSAK